MAKMPEPQQEEGCPAWLATYGDMVTLVLTFFVLLFSFSTMDSQKWKSLVQGFTGGPTLMLTAMDPDIVSQEIREGLPPTLRPGLIEDENDSNATPAPTPPDYDKQADANAQQSQEDFDRLLYQISEYIDTNGLAASLQATRSGDLILIRFRDNVLFDSGKAVIKEDGKVMIQHMYNLVMNALPSINRVNIEGHTDSVPIHNSQFTDNWELSGARSSAVLHYLLDLGMEPAKLKHSGYADTSPVDANDTAEGRARNRRVDVVIERKTVMEGVPVDTPSPEASTSTPIPETPVPSDIQELLDDDGNITETEGTNAE